MRGSWVLLWARMALARVSVSSSPEGPKGKAVTNKALGSLDRHLGSLIAVRVVCGRHPVLNTPSGTELSEQGRHEDACAIRGEDLSKTKHRKVESQLLDQGLACVPLQRKKRQTV